MPSDFNNLTALQWLWLVGAMTLVAMAAVAWRRKALNRLIDHPLQARVAPTHSRLRPILRASLVIAAMVAVVAALTDPRAGKQTEEVTRSGADVMFVVDVSRSMLAEDTTPNRLARAKLFIDDALRELGGDRVGLIDFAGVAAMRTPLTLNYGAMMASVDDLEPKDALRGGSMLGDAIKLAGLSFPSDSNAGRAIVVLSDGEDMGSDPVAAAKEIYGSKGVRVVTVGIGDTRDGGRIPVDRNGERTWLVHDGQEVWSKMDPVTLREVAAAGGGIYVPAGTAHVDLGEVLAQGLSDLERAEGESTTITTTIPQYQLPAGVALVLLVAECLVPDRRKAPKPATISGVTA